jgi:hypothetical protein
MTDYGCLGRNTGHRREPPAVCYHCGGDVEDTPRFGNEATCDDCARKGYGPPENPRERGDDDGVEYADPRDYLDGMK